MPEELVYSLTLLAWMHKILAEEERIVWALPGVVVARIVELMEPARRRIGSVAEYSVG